MAKHSELRQRILDGRSNASINFPELRQFMIRLGFDERIKGSHHIFSRSDLAEILNLQPRGSQAKPYQVRQVRRLLTKYGIGESRD